MESKTKVQLSRSAIKKLVKLGFGDASIVSVRELTDGWFNTAYHITLGNDVQTVLKISPPPEADILAYEKDLMRAEVEAMKIAAANPEIPVPQIIFDDLSRKHIPYDFYFMDYIEGITWDKVRETLTEEQNHSIEYQLGQITAHINEFEHTTFGYYASGPKFENWPDAFRWMCSLLFADAKRYSIELEISKQFFFDKLDEYRPVFEEIERPQLVHWDLWAGNILVTFEGEFPQISGIVDFERVLWGDPLMESYVGRLGNIPNYMAGYGEDVLATRPQRLRRIFYNIYLHLIMIIEDGPRDYDNKGSVRWAEDQLRTDIVMLKHGDVYDK